MSVIRYSGFPSGSDGKVSAYNAGDLGSTRGSEDPLEKGMATHSSVLDQRIPWTEEPGGLQSMGLQRDRHDRGTNTFTTRYKLDATPKTVSITSLTTTDQVLNVYGLELGRPKLMI